MAKKRKRKLLMPLVFLVLMPLLLIGGVILFVNNMCNQKKAAFEEAYSKLPQFEEEKEAKEVAAELGMEYPVEESGKTKEELSKQIKSIAKKAADKTFSPKERSQRILLIMKEYALASEGKEVTIQLRKTGRRVTGTYHGKESRGGGYYVTVGDSKYQLSNIMQEFHYLFIKADCDLIQKEKIREFKEKFNKERTEFYIKEVTKAEKKIYPAAEYMKDQNGIWAPKKEIFDKALDKRRVDFSRKKKREIKKLQKKYSFLFFYKPSIPENNAPEKEEAEGETSEERGEDS